MACSQNRGTQLCRRRVYRFPDGAGVNAAGRAIAALPCCTVTGVGARVALQHCPILRTGGYTTTTRVITYTYDPLNRLTGAAYSTGESFEYRYDAVGNRLALTKTISLDETTVTTYTYDAANRLTSAGDVTYTWDDRGNLVSDGTFTYAYNGAG
ncbi:MAG: hypothetical protein SXV54_09850, partial [Chloroflexota bacterium]|nr:hypothetical protein [Chloroflexota bacterium]